MIYSLVLSDKVFISKALKFCYNFSTSYNYPKSDIKQGKNKLCFVASECRRICHLKHLLHFSYIALELKYVN